MLEVISRDERMAEQLSDGIGNGVYRLLFRALASDPEEVRRFFDDTVEPLVSHDRQYRTDLLGTLESYLGQRLQHERDGARSVYAHRHTVAHRLTRIRELTGLDPGGRRRPRAARPRDQGLQDPRADPSQVTNDAAGPARRSQMPPQGLPPRASRQRPLPRRRLARAACG